jgi:hypothetical protein
MGLRAIVLSEQASFELSIEILSSVWPSRVGFLVQA